MVIYKYIMATANVIDKISDHVTCSLCLETYKEPKSLPCQHTFCCQCIKTYIEKQVADNWLGSQITQFRCPVCRAETTLPKDGVRAFPTNFTLQNIAQDIAQTETLNGVESQDVKEQKLCVSSESHGKLETSKWLCDKHKGTTVTHFCISCRTPLCSQCFVDIIGKDVNSHSKHIIHDLDKALEEIKNACKAKFQEVKSINSKLLDQTHSVAELQGKLSEDHQNILIDIAKVKTHVVEWAERLTEKANDFKKEHDKKLNETKHDLEINMAILQTSQQTINDRIKEKGPRILKDQVHADLDELLSTAEKFKASAEIPKFLNIYLDQTSIESKLENVLGDMTCEAQYVEGCDGSSSSFYNQWCEAQFVDGDDSTDNSFDNSSWMCDYGWDGGGNIMYELGDVTYSNNVITNILCSYKTVEDLEGMCFTKDFNLFAVNRRQKSIHHYSLPSNYHFITEEGVFGRGKLKDPMDIDELPDGSLAVCDGDNGHSVKIFSNYFGNGWTRSANIAHSMLKVAKAIAVSPGGDIIVSDIGYVKYPAVYRISLLGGDRYEVTTTIQTYDGGKNQFETPWHVACCSMTGNIAVADNKRHSVKCFNENGLFLWRYGRRHGVERLTHPRGLCFDSQGRLFVCDHGNRRIHIVSGQGIFICHMSYDEVSMSPNLICFTPKGDMVLGDADGLVNIVQMRFL